MTEDQLIARCKQAGALSVSVPWPGAVVATATRTVTVHFDRDASAPAGWRWGALVTHPDHDAAAVGSRPLANAAEVDGALSCWRRDERLTRLQQRRQRQFDRQFWPHRDHLDALAFGGRSSWAQRQRGGLTHGMLAAVNELAGTDRLRHALIEAGMSDDRLSAFPDRPGTMTGLEQVLIVGGRSFGDRHFSERSLNDRYLQPVLDMDRAIVLVGESAKAASNAMETLGPLLRAQAAPRSIVVLDDPVSPTDPERLAELFERMPTAKQLAADGWAKLVPGPADNRHNRRSKGKGRK